MALCHLPDVSCRLETALYTDLVKCGQCTRWQPFLTVEVGCPVNGSLRSLNFSLVAAGFLETPDAGRMGCVESLSRRQTREVGWKFVDIERAAARGL